MTIKEYNNKQFPTDKAICNLLQAEIDKNLPKVESKVWHAHPVWFLDENPIVGYSKRKSGVRLMFWSGASFDEEKLQPGTGKFKDASITYTSHDEVNVKDIKHWLCKATGIQWDYKNVVKKKGVLERLK